MFIVLEGMDGSGKGTHMTYIKNWLNQHCIDYIATFEPGGTTLGITLRDIILHQDMHAVTELLLLYAARYEHIKTVIEPTLAQKKWVLCDRFFYSTFAYQAYAKGLSSDWVNELQQWLMPDMVPDVLIYLDIDAHIAHQRCQSRQAMGIQKTDKFEEAGVEFYTRVRAGYQACITNVHPRTKVYVIDAVQSIADIQDQLNTVLISFISN